MNVSDLIELSFHSQQITARFRQGEEKSVDLPRDAARLIQQHHVTSLPVSIDTDGQSLAERTAEIAGMRIEARNGVLTLLRPGKPPETLQPPQRRPQVTQMISLGKGLGMVNDAAAAYAMVLAHAGERPPKQIRFHRFATQTFLGPSSSLGRVTALFKNLQDYGVEIVLPKISDWDKFVRTESSDVLDAHFVSLFDRKIDPRDVTAVGGKDQVMPYFKAWVLLNVAAEHR